MIALGLKPDETNYLPAYRKLIEQISELFFWRLNKARVDAFGVTYPSFIE
jgi:hypothetical protein